MYTPRKHKDRYIELGLLVVLSIGLFPSELPAQSSNREKPKLKDFGSSLRKLKWDPVKKEGRETVSADQRTSSDDDVIKIDTSLVACDVLVTDQQGRPIRNLTAGDFTINEDGVPQQVGHFFLGDNVSLPRSIVLIIDYSRSQFPYIKESVEAAKGFVDKLGPQDRMAIVTDDVELLVGFTNDKRDLKKRLDSLVAKNNGSKGFLGLRDKRPHFGRSAQYSALMATLKEAFDDEDERPIIVFQTDGDELEYLRDSVIVPTVPAGLSPALRTEVQEEIEERLKLQRVSVTEFSLEDVYRAIEKSRATIYTIIPGIRLLGFPRNEQLRRLRSEDEKTIATWLEASPPKVRAAFLARQEQRKEKLTPQILDVTLEEELKIQSTLSEVAKLSGGWAEFLETGSRAAEIYSRIFADLNERYIVGYYPANKERDGKRRRITIEVKGHPDYVIASRKWYYAPED
jgi:VWFA-related protein